MDKLYNNFKISAIVTFILIILSITWIILDYYVLKDILSNETLLTGFEILILKISIAVFVCLILSFLVSLFYAFRIGIKSKKNQHENPPIQNNEIENIPVKPEENCMEMLFLEQPAKDLKSDFFEIDSLNINGNCLEIVVNYGGGCGDADFNLYYSDSITERMPPETKFYLVLKDDDPCRSIVHKKLKYSLEFYKDVAKNSGIYLHVSGKEEPVLYYLFN